MVLAEFIVQHSGRSLERVVGFFYVMTPSMLGFGGATEDLYAKTSAT